VQCGVALSVNKIISCQSLGVVSSYVQPNTDAHTMHILRTYAYAYTNIHTQDK
jgi:hypothetical protein